MHTRYLLLAALAPNLVLAASAGAQEFCVTCASPEASYRCLIGGEAPMAARSSRGQFLCITELAKAGGHASCSATRGQATPCPGETRTVMFTVGDPGASPLETTPMAAPPAPVSPVGAYQRHLARPIAAARSATAACACAADDRGTRDTPGAEAERRRELCQEDGRGDHRHRHRGGQRCEEDVGLRRLAVRRLLAHQAALLSVWRSTRGRDAGHAISAASTSRGKSRSGSAWRRRCRASPRD